MHLEKYAIQVLQVMPEEERKDYNTVVKKFKERFLSVNIEKLKGTEKKSQLSN